jgi:CTP:molybdopterin cytidylyltransferase MocA
VILAAGSSERLGQPKALLPIDADGTPLVAWLLSRLERAEVPTLIVTNVELAPTIMAACPGVTVVINPNPDAGRVGSLQHGIKAWLDTKGSRQAFRLLIVPVDRPGWSDSTLSKLLESKVSACPEAVGKGGHPLYMLPDELGHILSAAPDAPLNRLVSPDRIAVDDPYLHLNLDTPQDIELLRTFIASLV